MSRPHAPYRVKARGKYWYYKLPDMPDFKVILPRILVGNPKFSKRKAELFCERLTTRAPASRNIEFFGEYAEPYFKNDQCPWWVSRVNNERDLLVKTRSEHRARLINHIMLEYKGYRFAELSPVQISTWILTRDLSSQSKKHLYNTFKIILWDLYRERLITFHPSELTIPTVRNKETDTLPEDLALRLFPKDIDEFRRVWKRSFATGVMLAADYSAGMRTSEARALPWEGINWKLRGIKICQTINKDGVPWVPQKGRANDKGEKKKIVRVIPVPEWTLELFKALPTYRFKTGLIFPGMQSAKEPGRVYMKIDSPNNALRRVVESLELDIHITPHGLRHSYNTRMRKLLSEIGMDQNFSDEDGFLTATEASDKVLRAFMGHSSPNMTELYDHPELDKKLEFIDKNFREQVEEYWNLPEPEPIEKTETDNLINDKIEQVQGA